MIIPNYKKDNIVNLMSSILASMNVKSPYVKLNSININKLKKKKNIVLIVIDGLGYEWLNNKTPNSFITSNIKQKLCSVFPSTTATAIPLFMTGYPGQQHALTAWTVFFKEIGTMANVLPSVPTMGGNIFSDYGVDFKEIYNFESLFKNIKRQYNIVTEKELVYSDFNKTVTSHTNNYLYSGESLNQFFRKIKRLTKKKDKKYIYAYWPYFDKYCHRNGPDSKEVLEHYIRIDKKLQKFIKKINLKDTTVIVTADHGFIEVPLAKKVEISAYPEIVDCLTMPLCGEGRVRYVYVKPAKAKEFEKLVKTKWASFCSIIKSEDAIKNNYFGLFEVNSKLKNRIGDYVLIMKEDYALCDRLINKSPSTSIGRHGGVSELEMFVPLVIFEK